ncbi:phosphonate ABC transporter ATP-binding protein [Halalkalibacter hemicellulosilyticus]|uniref:Phosphonate ABC transporter ATP-binding protein n=1 Tax=Halalkalibacter hemicellulosilyticusJCM 9152 TaxID=1236971 RepID=W4QIH3_9BACI|nr:phosphonate ABC transporter ATP-binding protein [Halalkalibacter hemicellulosilyticus]GAE31418.1 phosphonate ABC transporter ATP-binding protein [Halalkalibacter hemicellulosilyticusJCM 9152]
MALLEVRRLSKVYSDGTTALQDISFELHNGEFIVIIGPSGAGKNTLLRSINRLVKPTAGELLFKGQEIVSANASQLKKHRREVGMIFQRFNLIERSSVLRNVLHGRLGYMNIVRAVLSLFSKEDKDEAIRFLERVGLGEQVYKRADELSGGQQQRVGIARAIAQKPSLILADEPIASLDPVSSEIVMDQLYSICKEEGIACLCNLHQVDVAKKYATRIIGINNGEKVFDGRPEELTDTIIERIYRGSKEQKEEMAS